MKTRWLWIIPLATLLAACRTIAAPTSTTTSTLPATDTVTIPPTATTRVRTTPAAIPTVDRVQPSPTPTVEPVPASADENTQTPTVTARPLSAFTMNLADPFGAVSLTSWQPQPYSGIDYSLPIDPSQVANPQVISGLTDEQRAFLAQNGFVVIHSREAQFCDIRDSVSTYHGQPYFLTVDSAFHALHLTFEELLKDVEREELRPRMVSITRATLDQILAYQPAVRGTSIEVDTQLAAAYLSVALRLFDPVAEIDPSVQDQVSRQIEQIMAGIGREDSALIPDFVDDYSAYKPVGHYVGDVELEQYFRGMSWFGRVHLKLNDADPGFVPSRAPLIITLALRQAQTEDGTAAEDWVAVHEVLTFMIGPTDDGGPAEYAALMDQVYGDNHTVTDLTDAALWESFLLLGQQIHAPQINSTFVDWVTTDMESEQGWRFMGQRFTLDAFIFQNLVFDRVEPLGEKSRLFPTGLDVMAVFGSQAARETLYDLGETSYPNYLEQMTMLQDAAQAQPEAQWLNRFYDAWLYTLFPLVASKAAAYPAYMQTGAWAYKDLNTALGGWAELKHDTILYTKMPEAAGGGGPPRSGPAPGYVEANPNAFYRLAYLPQTLVDGLERRNIRSSFSWETANLANWLRQLGDIAVKELRGEPLSDKDLWAVQGCMGRVDPLSLEIGGQTMLPSVPIIAAAAGGGPLDDRVLEVGIGYVDRVYVIVFREGRMHVAQGGVFSYYEFLQPRSKRLTDQEWQGMLDGEDITNLPVWSSNFVLPGGSPADWLAFRIDDAYIVTQEGAGLALRESPSLDGVVVRQFQTGDYLSIVDGPVIADGFTWWQVQGYFWPEITVGWAVEEQGWYERAWGQ
jgi:hypothetical protein